MNIRFKYLLFIVSFLLYLVSSCSDETVSGSSKVLMMTSFSVKSPNDDNVYSLDVASDGTITNKDEIPLDVDFSRLIATFETNSPSAKVMVGDMIQESGVTENDFSSPVVYRICDDSGNSRNYTVELMEEMQLLSIGISDNDDCRLCITSDRKIFNLSPLSEDFDNSSVIINYKTTNPEYLLYTESGTCIESNKTKIDCSKPIKIIMKSPNGNTVDYYLNLYKTIGNGIINVNPSEVKHEYIGGGASGLGALSIADLMTSEDKAYFMDLLFRDLRLRTLQYYTQGRPSDNRQEYDNVYRYISEAKKYNPDIEITYVIGKFPTDLCYQKNVNGELVNCLDIDRDGVDIYQKVAEFMLELMNDIYDRYGYKIAIFSMSNEPDFEKSWRWGLQDSKRGLGKMLNEVLPYFKELLKSDYNYNNLECPKFMGPSTMTPKGCWEFLSFWDDNFPNVLKNIDIVSTHQYSPKYGCIPDWYEEINKICDKYGIESFYQTEQHVNKGDDIGDDYLPDNYPLRGITSLARLFASSVNFCANSWYYFCLSTDNKHYNAGLIYTPKDGGTPIPTEHYYAFKQLHNFLPLNGTNVIGYENDNEFLDIVCFKVENENRIVVHIGNKANEDILLTVNINGLKPNGLRVWNTGKDKSMEQIIEADFIDYGYSSVNIVADEYSLTTLDIFY